MDVQAYCSIIKILQSPEKFKNDLEGLYDVLDFTYQLSNGDVVEIIPNGKNVKLNSENISLFLDSYLKTRFNECKEQINSIQEGFL